MCVVYVYMYHIYTYIKFFELAYMSIIFIGFVPSVKVLVNLRAITNGLYRKFCFYFYLNQFLFINRKTLYSSYNTRIRTYSKFLFCDAFPDRWFFDSHSHWIKTMVVCAGCTEQVFTKHKEYLAITNILFNYCGIRYKRTFFYHC